jgi:hypothetical protein
MPCLWTLQEMGIVKFGHGQCGFHSRQDDHWLAFQEFKSYPNIDFKSQNVRFVDLTADGHADILISGDHILTWYKCSGYDGSQVPFTTLNTLREARVVFTDAREKIYLADMTVCPTLFVFGMGVFSIGSTLGTGNLAPSLPWTMRLSSITWEVALITNIASGGHRRVWHYVNHKGIVTIYFNESGNGFADVQRLALFPLMDNLATINAMDLFGMSPAKVSYQ